MVEYRAWAEGLEEQGQGQGTEPSCPFEEYVPIFYRLLYIHQPTPLAPEPAKSLDNRARFNSLDSGILLNSPASRPEKKKGPSTSTTSLLDIPIVQTPVDGAFPEDAAAATGLLAADAPPAGSIAVRAIRSMRSLARMASWAQLSNDKEGNPGPAPAEAPKTRSKDKEEKKERKEKERKRDSKGAALPTTMGEAEKKKEEDEKPFALKDLHLRVPKGAFVAIVGRVGSGKVRLH